MILSRTRRRNSGVSKGKKLAASLLILLVLAFISLVFLGVRPIPVTQTLVEKPIPEGRFQ